MRAEDAHGRHISGAEGVFDPSTHLIQSVVKSYIARAMNHPRGDASKIVITLEQITRKPLVIESLAVATLKSASVKECEAETRLLLSDMGLSARAIAAAMRVVRSKKVMRGAAIIEASTGRRLEPDSARGVRATMLGITPDASRQLNRKLGRAGIKSETVAEALILASKVACAKGVIAELCVSDDPDYTTGYVASMRHGYVRIPNIKMSGSMSGGRVIFVDGKADVSSLIRYLEKRTVIVGAISTVRRTVLLATLLSK